MSEANRGWVEQKQLFKFSSSFLIATGISDRSLIRRKNFLFHRGISDIQRSDINETVRYFKFFNLNQRICTHLTCLQNMALEGAC